mgnify:CR=1 FL=1
MNYYHGNTVHSHRGISVHSKQPIDLKGQREIKATVLEDLFVKANMVLSDQDSNDLLPSYFMFLITIDSSS